MRFNFRFNDSSLTRRVWAVMSVYGLALLLIMAASGWGLFQARSSLSNLHDERMMTAEQVNSLMQEFYDSRLNILLGFQHNPQSELYSLHGHELSLHTSVVRKNEEAWKQHKQALESRDLDAREAELLKTLDQHQNAWLAKAREAVVRLEASDFSPPSMQEFLVAGRTEGDALLKSLTALRQYQSVMADQAVAAAEQRFEAAVVAFGLILLLVVLPGMMLMLYTMRRLSRGFRRAVRSAQAIAAGDLAYMDHDDAGDEIGKLITQMRHMRDNLNSLIGRIVAGSDSIAQAADTVAAGTQDLSARTEQQAAALEQTSAATEELNSTVHQNADNASEVDRMAIATSQMAERGGTVTDNAVKTMETIRQASEKIGDIVNIIDGIAFQTNILALNAAVEAARAGEAGKGFAVVASEVRALAQRSAGAAHEIKHVIQESVDGIRNGSEQVSQVGVAMGEIVESFRHMTALIGEIASASKEQAIGLRQINEAVNHMDGTTQRNAMLVESTLRTSELLQSQAADFRALVSTFRLSAELAAPFHADEPRVFDSPAIALGR
ncbi:methyl-accepting chemotaxis protein [Parapusillimonas granuli]|uniref:HAMP domain-containing protein n=1 Tax=Parapusillimonas granuli TaxID=380911 RepID=A0A853G239_9BURK|nr:methyl-accepting chemotaxis protein [Parapusillimonas granuli]MBB5213938.1 methyl-accepting chemotaxis protein [Parapusillimonas granuli]MEB2400797.1 methyl-accepting chemotaxis protein [Alcaligenaceae bacterium]NYT50359.1 HAMP domain-containing protein [Parapusillimonas granuli]